MLLFENVTKQYGARPVLDNINLKIEGGEFVTLIGQSGAGKSTLLHALIGATKIDKGGIYIDGYPVHEFDNQALQSYRRNLGVIFQDYKLLNKKNVFENIAYAMEVCGCEDESIQTRVIEVLRLVGMIDHQSKFPDELSGGEKQKTAIARALVHNPKLIIADEPTGNLDPEASKSIIELLLMLNTVGITVILATHNKDLVNMIQRRVVVLKQGQIVSDRAKSGYEVVSKIYEEMEILEIKEE
ncbi:MAG: cell division ATP-binding protein FtsE, cell division transport system ATP-binding protein [Candidatus Peregrinibacteria bacterium GW2011_GWF2_33_10]|nr:MAG: cell division ATP-binding protein FtsE, cell division transport system ATP-binding protein [Candidatus Peregrinibacteria bacterium GW2011_GWF2_33_10]OGJ44195.1 MAG: hypothetical protein A2263_04440 [Candidatus Peregrinibacteria bacterium RIFOXYA2_FULL_33_21]OGJ46679.1 MAG: hypothetical protein A2272_04700 [Candidatus Peregrinibacteria bacterium RIFOXYA12_FULL_33_12]OGJ51824.1 MAG: hypothetical protein A2307_05105 [Candidatus Peregrinibacteria bacterium RIFOXYB2_FULL_33_20]